MLIDATQFPLVWMQFDSSDKSAAPSASDEFEALLARKEIVSLFIALLTIDARMAKTSRGMRSTSIATRSLNQDCDSGDEVLH